MDFGKLKEKATELGSSSTEKINQLVEELKNAIHTATALGLSVKDFRVGIGVLPEIEAKLVGSLESVAADKIQELIDANQENKILISILKGLQTASKFKDQLGGLGFKEIEVDIKLGVSPKISIRYVD